MENSKVDLFLMNNNKFFNATQLMMAREQLLKLDESKWILLQTASFKDPTLMLVVSILVGTLGIDRFIIGDIGLGIGKLLTCGGLGIWAIVDFFLIMDATRSKNMEALMRIIY